MQTDKEAFREFVRGASSILVVIGVILLAAVLLGKEEEDPILNNFKVVDTYKGCNVVRYIDQSQRWHYFLHCTQK